MNKITFDEMLRANDLPPVGEIVTTPAGDKVEVIAYTYGEDYSVMIHFTGGHAYANWTFDQIRLCTWEGKE